MKTYLLLLVLALAAISGAVSCKTARLVDTWVPGAYQGAPYKRVMIVGLNPSPPARSQYENDFVDKLANYGVLAVASINVVPELRDVDHETVESWLTEYTLDGVIVTRVTNEKPARSYKPPHLSLSGWYGAWMVDSQTVTGNEKFFVEADLFDAKTEDLVYSAALKTKLEDDRSKTIHAVIDRLAADMIKRGYFQHP